jgi:hypothetical protein
VVGELPVAPAARRDADLRGRAQPLRHHRAPERRRALGGAGDAARRVRGAVGRRAPRRPRRRRAQPDRLRGVDRGHADARDRFPVAPRAQRSRAAAACSSCATPMPTSARAPIR